MPNIEPSLTPQVGETIKTLRVDTGLKQHELAQAVGVTHGLYFPDREWQARRPG